MTALKTSSGLVHSAVFNLYDIDDGRVVPVYQQYHAVFTQRNETLQQSTAR